MIAFALALAAAPDMGCVRDFQGRWALTAQGAPYLVLQISSGLKQEIVGSAYRRAQSHGTLHDTTASGPIAKHPLRVSGCQSDSVEIAFADIAMRLVREDSGVHAELMNIPTGVRSPKYRAIKVDLSVLPGEFSDRPRDEVEPEVSHDSELAELFNADQSIRSEVAELRRKGLDTGTAQIRMEEGDRVRLARLRELILANRLKTGLDYWRAAFLFQHGGRAANYLYAHHLANVSLKLGYREAAWIAAASMDRYLLSIGQPQIYGTQFQVRGDTNARLNLDRDFLSDADRAALDVPALSVN